MTSATLKKDDKTAKKKIDFFVILHKRMQGEPLTHAQAAAAAGVAEVFGAATKKAPV